MNGAVSHRPSANPFCCYRASRAMAVHSSIGQNDVLSCCRSTDRRLVNPDLGGDHRPSGRLEVPDANEEPSLSAPLVVCRRLVQELGVRARTRLGVQWNYERSWCARGIPVGPAPILAQKLRQPRLWASIVSRARLIERLNDGVNWALTASARR